MKALPTKSSTILKTCPTAQRPDNPDMLGYMLRGFFETQRRHVAWENAVVMPLAYARLTQDDLRELSRVMLDNRKEKRLRTVRSEFSLFAFQTRSD